MSWTENDNKLMLSLFVDHKLPLVEIGNVFWLGVGSVRDHLRHMGIDPNFGKDHQPSILKLSGNGDVC